MRLWGGRFSEDNDKRVADFGRRAIDVAASSPSGHVRGAPAPFRRTCLEGVLSSV